MFILNTVVILGKEYRVKVWYGNAIARFNNWIMNIQVDEIHGWPSEDSDELILIENFIKAINSRYLNFRKIFPKTDFYLLIIKKLCSWKFSGWWGPSSREPILVADFCNDGILPVPVKFYNCLNMNDDNV